MPRTARVKYETIFDTLKVMSIFNENGELKKKKDPVWKEACQIMKEINLHNLYLFVHQDRRQIKTNLMKYLNIKCATSSKNKKKYKRESIDDYHGTWNEFDYYETLDNDDVDNNQEIVFSDLNTLISMMNSEEYKHIIHKIGVLPFCVNYWHPQQIALWNDLINVKSTVSLIVLDNIISNITEDFESGNIFLYALACEKENSIILLGQMMSNSTKSMEIQYFLSSWLQNNAQAPPELAIGYSYSLLDAVSVAFNFCTFDKYNIRCYKYLMNEISDLPPTLIQIDLITLIKVVDGWTCFENILQAVKDLYLCSIMYLSTLENLDEFREAVISILTLCQSPFQSDETESRKTILWEHLTTDDIQEMNQQYIQYVTGKYGLSSFSFFNVRQNPTISDSPHEIYDYINQLKLQAFEICDFSMNTDKIPNSYYCPVALDNLMQLLVEFPSWTKIIVKKSECSTLVSSCATKHLFLMSELHESVNPPQFLVYHIEKIEKLIQEGKRFINGKKSRNQFCIMERKNNHVHLVQTACDKEYEYNDTTEIIAPIEEINLEENADLDLSNFKNAIRSTILSLIDFDECVQNILDIQTKPGQEIVVCKCLLDCCAEMKTYEKFFGMIAGRFCSSNAIFAESFKRIFEDCYNTIELLEKNELKNISKLFAHLLITDSMSWEILSIFELNPKYLTIAKKNFIRVLLRELSEHMGISSLQEKFRNKKYKSAFKGLFPFGNSRDAQFAASFFKSIGLKGLGDIMKENLKTEEESSKLKRSTSNSSVSSNSSACDFVIEVRVSKKNDKTNTSLEEKKKIIVRK